MASSVFLFVCLLVCFIFVVVVLILKYLEAIYFDFHQLSFQGEMYSDLLECSLTFNNKQYFQHILSSGYQQHFYFHRLKRKLRGHRKVN